MLTKMYQTGKMQSYRVFELFSKMSVSDSLKNGDILNICKTKHEIVMPVWYILEHQLRLLQTKFQLHKATASPPAFSLKLFASTAQLFLFYGASDIVARF